MCRGCFIYKDGNATCDEYLEWFDKYRYINYYIKELEKDLLNYIKEIDGNKNKKIIDIFRRKLINLRKDYNKLDYILNEIKEIGDEVTR